MGEGSIPRDAAVASPGEEEERASLELFLPSCVSLNGEVFLSRPWRSWFCKE